MSTLKQLINRITFCDVFNAHKLILKKIKNGGFVTFIGLHGFSEQFINKEYKNSINESKIIFCDSMFPKFLHFFLKLKLPNKSPGPDVLTLLLSSPEVSKFKICFYGGGQKLINKVKKKFSLTSIYQIIPGIIDYKDKKYLNEEFKKINNLDIDILIIGLGCPKQEIIANHFHKINNKIFIMPVGAALNFISDDEKRSPQIFSTLNIEFLWRLKQSPKFISKRIIFSLTTILVNFFK